MNTIQRIAKNTAVLYGAHIVNALLGLFLTIYIARMLGDVIFGKYSFALVFTALFAVFIDLGFTTLIVRDVARDKSAAPKYLGNIGVITAILSVIIFGLIALIINLMHYPQDTTAAVLIFGVVIVFNAFGNLFRVTFRAFERMEYEALTLILRRVITFSLGLVALLLGYGLIEIAYVFAIGGMIDLLLSSLICVKKFARPKIEFDFDFWKKAAKVALPIASISIAAMIYIMIDTVMLSVMKGDAVVGWYNAAYNLVRALELIPFFLGTALFPLMAILSVSSQGSLRIIYERSLRYLLILGLPLAVGTTLLADRIILLFYGEQYINSIIALQILAWDILLFFLYVPLGRVILALDKQNQIAAVAGGCALINIILNLILIPPFSYIGAGIATIVTETVLFGAYFYVVSKYLYRLPLHKVIAKPVVACLVMALFVYFYSGINLAVLIISAAALYLGVLYLIKGFSQEDINLLKRAIKISKG